MKTIYIAIGCVIAFVLGCAIAYGVSQSPSITNELDNSEQTNKDDTNKIKDVDDENPEDLTIKRNDMKIDYSNLSTLPFLQYTDELGSYEADIEKLESLGGSVDSEFLEDVTENPSTVIEEVEQ